MIDNTIYCPQCCVRLQITSVKTYGGCPLCGTEIKIPLDAN